jgi:cell wall-associated NlpC family hydrolase
MRLKSISILIFIVSLIASTLFAQEENEMERIKSVINELEQKYAPDSRTAIFKVSAEQENDNYILKGETNFTSAKEELLRKLNNFNTIDQIKILPDSDLGEDIYGIINLSVANLRTKPENQAEMASQALLGTPIKVLKKKKGWYLVQTPDQYIAWIENDGFYRVSFESLSAWNKSDKIIYTKDFGFTYSKPDINSERVTDIVIGDILKYSGEENGFCKVVYPDGEIAFIKSEDCKPFKEWLNQADPTVENIIKTAKTFMGIPYLWGGTSAKGMDCSGFTKTVFFLNGIVLPRDASQQVNIGEPINTKDKLESLEPGDLLFFGRKASDTTNQKITHVAIYIGDGDFINASGKVRIDSFSKDKPNYSAYRDDSFVCAKRVLNSIGSRGVVTISKNKFYSLGQ